MGPTLYHSGHLPILAHLSDHSQETDYILKETCLIRVIFWLYSIVIKNGVFICCWTHKHVQVSYTCVVGCKTCIPKQTCSWLPFGRAWYSWYMDLFAWLTCTFPEGGNKNAKTNKQVLLTCRGSVLAKAELKVAIKTEQSSWTCNTSSLFVWHLLQFYYILLLFALQDICQKSFVYLWCVAKLVITLYFSVYVCRKWNLLVSFLSLKAIKYTTKHSCNTILSTHQIGNIYFTCIFFKSISYVKVQDWSIMYTH